MKSAFYPGSFDPVTHGHADIIARAAAVFDRVVIGIGVHDAKRPMFNAQERIDMLQKVLDDLSSNARRPCTFEIATFDGLAIVAAQEAGAQVFVRGLRDGTDLDYEAQLAGMNAAMAPQIETIFLPASPTVRHIAANLVRQIATMGGDTTPFVAAHVAHALAARVQQ